MTSFLVGELLTSPGGSCQDSPGSDNQRVKGQLSVVDHSFLVQLIQHLQTSLCYVWSSFVMQQNRAFSVDQCSLQLL